MRKTEPTTQSRVDNRLRDKATRAVASLREFHRMGAEARKRAPNTGVYSPGVSIQLAAKYGISRGLVDKARAFAVMYDEADLEELCGLRNSQGMPLVRGHVIHLLSIKDRRQRRAFQRKAIQHDWSVRQLVAEIRKRFGKSGKGGRKPPKPESLSDALQQIVRLSEPLLRWYRELEKQAVGGGFSLTNLPKPVEQHLQKTIGCLQHLTVETRKEMRLERRPRGFLAEA